MPPSPPVAVRRSNRSQPVEILAPLIDTYLDQRNRDTHRAANSWHASKLGKTCYRQLFYDRIGAPPERWILPQYSRDADAGTALHEVYQKYLEAMGVLHVVEETTDQNVWRIGGRKDGVSHGGEAFKRFVAPGEKGLLEIKTLKTAAWEMMPDGYKWPGFYDQMQVYFQLDPELTRGLLLCINRDDSRLKEFVVERNDPYGKYLLARASYLEACYQAGEVPIAEPSKLCEWCQYQTRCDLDDLKEVA